MPWNAQVDAARIVFIIMLMRILVLHIPLRFYFDKFFSDKSLNSTITEPFYEKISLIKRIGQQLPWKITCLMESMSIKYYLRRYNINVPIHICVFSQDTFRAHAWVLESDSEKHKKNILLL